MAVAGASDAAASVGVAGRGAVEGVMRPEGAVGAAAGPAEGGRLCRRFPLSRRRRWNPTLKASLGPTYAARSTASGMTAK